MKKKKDYKKPKIIIKKVTALLKGHFAGDGIEDLLLSECQCSACVSGAHGC